MNSKDVLEEYVSFIGKGRNHNYRKIASHTYVVKTSDAFGNPIYGVQYHRTVVCGIREDGSYFINNGGYFTVTTKKRINDFLSKVGNNRQIIQRNFQWFLSGFNIGQGFMVFDVNNEMTSCSSVECFAFPLTEEIGL